MELLDRYLFAVSKHLPQARREDLIAELKDNLLSQIEDEEASLGRPLTTDEIAEVLRKHGRPLLVALQYLPQQHLIGRRPVHLLPLLHPAAALRTPAMAESFGWTARVR